MSKRKVELFFSRCREAIQSPYEVLWTGVVLVACKFFTGAEKTAEIQSEDGFIPPRYWRGVKIGHSVINVSAFTDEALFGAGGANDYIPLRCFIEKKVLRQDLFHPSLQALERCENSPKGDRQHWIILALRSFRAILEAYPSILGTDLKLQEKFKKFINPKFGLPNQGFMSEEQQRLALNDPEWGAEFKKKIATIQFDQVYNPIRLEGIDKGEFLEALRRREVYELRLDGELDNFEQRRENSVFSIIQRKLFDLQFVHRKTAKAIHMDRLTLDLQHEVKVQVQPSEIMIACKFFPEINELQSIDAENLVVPFNK